MFVNCTVKSELGYQTKIRGVPADFFQACDWSVRSKTAFSLDDTEIQNIPLNSVLDPFVFVTSCESEF